MSGTSTDQSLVDGKFRYHTLTNPDSKRSNVRHIGTLYLEKTSYNGGLERFWVMKYGF